MSRHPSTDCGMRFNWIEALLVRNRTCLSPMEEASGAEEISIAMAYDGRLPG